MIENFGDRMVEELFLATNLSGNTSPKQPKNFERAFGYNMATGIEGPKEGNVTVPILYKGELENREGKEMG